MGVLERSLSVHFKARGNRSAETHASGFSAYQKAMARRPILLPHLFPRLPSFHVARCALTLRFRSPPSLYIVDLPAVPPEGVSNLLVRRFIAPLSLCVRIYRIV
jgi:hypothetical protein